MKNITFKKNHKQPGLFMVQEIKTNYILLSFILF